MSDDPFDRKIGPAYTYLRESAERPAPVHIRGVRVSKPESGEKMMDTLLGGAEKALEISRKAFVRYATQKGRQEAAFSEILQKTIAETVLAEGATLAEKAPFGKAILVAIELSEAFADGCGEAMLAVNAQLMQEYDISQISLGELTERDIEILQGMRRYQLRAVEVFPDILKRGLLKVAEKAAEMLVAKALKIPVEILKNLSAQIAGQIIQQYDLPALFSQAVRQAAGSIPEGRRKVYSAAFRFVAGMFIEQLDQEKLRQRLKSLPNVVSRREPIDVAILASLIELLMTETYSLYARMVGIPEAEQELKIMLREKAHNLLLQTRNQGVIVEASRSGTLEVEPYRIVLPSTLLLTIENSGRIASQAEITRFWNRVFEFDNYEKSLNLILEAKAIQYNRLLNRMNGEDAVYLKYQNRWADERKAAVQKAREVRQAVLNEFGEVFDGITVKNWLGIDIPIRDIRLPLKAIPRPPE